MGDEGHNISGAVNSGHLRAFIERIERLEEEKRAIADDIKEVYLEARGTGFDTKTIRTIIKLRAMSADERAEQEALLDIYRAALGMLDGTPLGEAAIRRLSEKPKSAPATKPDGIDPEAPAPEPEAEIPSEPEPDLDEAKFMGKEAAASGKPVTANPFPARDPRRSAWDEAWCAHSGSDGMDIPDAWRRAPKKKPENADQDAKK